MARHHRPGRRGESTGWRTSEWDGSHRLADLGAWILVRAKVIREAPGQGRREYRPTVERW